MPQKTKSKNNGVIPGMEEFVVEKQDEWMWEGQKQERFFDAIDLPDSPGKQQNTIETHAMYLLFPDRETLIRGFTAITQGARKGLSGKTKIVSINSMALTVDGISFLEMWEQFMLGIMPEEKADSDEAQAPI